MLLEANVLHQVQSAVLSSQKETASRASLYPSNYVLLLTRKPHSTTWYLSHSSSPRHPRWEKGEEAEAEGDPRALVSCAPKGSSGAGAAVRGSPSSLPSLFSLKFIVKGQHSRVRHVTLSGPAYCEPDHPHRGRWSCLIETGM